MKYIIGVVTSVFLVVLLYSQIPSLSIDSVKIEGSLKGQVLSDKILTLEAPLHTVKLRELRTLEQQCKDRKATSNKRTTDMHQVVIDALKTELLAGRTEQELMAYAQLYQTHYKSYDDLIKLASLSLERSKYNVITDARILSDWQGLGVLDVFSSDKKDLVISELIKLEGKANFGTLNLRPTETPSESEVLRLLENKQSFLTYLDSPLRVLVGHSESYITQISSQYISPSILFVMTAKALHIDQFHDAVRLVSFTVNEIAIAIINQLPTEYLMVLLDNTPMLTDMPIIAQSQYESYSNLADVAAAHHRVEVLKLLTRYGVYPINEPGLMTGLDLAIMNLPKQKEANLDIDNFPTKYQETIEYLRSNGYKAHGGMVSFKDTLEPSFYAPYKRSYFLREAKHPELKQVLSKLDLITTKDFYKTKPQDGSTISIALTKVKHQRSVNDKTNQSCTQVSADILTVQNFATRQEVSEIMKEFKKADSEGLSQLHNIDPALVDRWRFYYDMSEVEEDIGPQFSALIRAKDLEPLMEYVTTTRLTMNETDTLLWATITEPDNYLPVWQARIEPKGPSGLVLFERAKFSTWKILLEGGFDFSITDQKGNDLFVAATVNSNEALELLLDQNLVFTASGLGLDPIDILLEQSFTQGYLQPTLFRMLKMVEHLEPNHLSRIARLKHYYPKQYEKLVALDRRTELPGPTEMNRFRRSKF